MKWISVDDRLPKPMVHVLVCMAGHIVIGWRSWTQWSSGGVPIYPTHWTPLPKPPKRKGAK